MMHRIATLLVLLALRISAKTMQVELYRTGHRLAYGAMSSSHVTSSMQCLHKCRKEDGCKGINMKLSTPNDVVCQICTKSKDEENVELVEDDGWQFYNVIDLKKYVIHVESFATTSDGFIHARDLSYISVNGQRFAMKLTGLWMLAFNYEKGLDTKTFHHVDIEDVQIVFPKLLSNVKDGSVVVVGMTDTTVEFGSQTADNVKSALRNIGANDVDIGFRMSYCLITMKGQSVTWKTEVLKGLDAGQSVCKAMI